MGSDTESEKKKTPVALAPIAKPLAGKKLCKRTLKLVRRGPESFSFPGSVCACCWFRTILRFFFLQFISFRFAASEAKCLKRGVKEVVKSIRRGQKGCVFSDCAIHLVFYSSICSLMVQ